MIEYGSSSEKVCTGISRGPIGSPLIDISSRNIDTTALLDDILDILTLLPVDIPQQMAVLPLSCKKFRASRLSSDTINILSYLPYPNH